MASPKAKEESPQDSKPSRMARWALEGLDSLVLLPGLFKNQAGQDFIRLLKWLSKEGGEPAKGFRRYGKLWKTLVESQEFARHPRVGTFLQDYFLETLLEDPNSFHRKAELAPLSQVNPSLMDAYQGELDFFRKLLRTDWEKEFLKKSGFLGKKETPSLEGIQEATKESGLDPVLKARKKIKEKLISSSIEGAELVSETAQFFHQNGWGLFGHYRAFRWMGRPEGAGRLEGIEATDPIRLENLVGYDEQRKPLIDNIEAFVAGKPANNVLIYGERGTGKSSTVKALLNAYGDRGLRLVEVLPGELKDLHEILKFLRGRREKFILFVDDLSFEENETSYKGLKALLEGTVEATPENVILIATSNRRHLIREFFTDRAGGLQQEGEIHGADTVEEKLSLSDRFGLVISFYTPNQDIYLKIVESWAKFFGIKMKAEELHARAILWARRNNGPSGRTARQFINDLKGKL
jgi:uncharacterized protein